jgi:hypothetical protein
MLAKEIMSCIQSKTGDLSLPILILICTFYAGLMADNGHKYNDNMAYYKRLPLWTDWQEEVTAHHVPMFVKVLVAK